MKGHSRIAQLPNQSASQPRVVQSQVYLRENTLWIMPLVSFETKNTPIFYTKLDVNPNQTKGGVQSAWNIFECLPFCLWWNMDYQSFM